MEEEKGGPGLQNGPSQPGPGEGGQGLCVFPDHISISRQGYASLHSLQSLHSLHSHSHYSTVKLWDTYLTESKCEIFKDSSMYEEQYKEYEQYEQYKQSPQSLQSSQVLLAHLRVDFRAFFFTLI